jgi:pimeloyl-ACP methyl ester carboxylesterase
MTEDEQLFGDQRPYRVLVVALVLVLAGGALANWTQTAGGDVDVRDVAFAGPNGSVYSATLYVPSDATDDDPAPGVVAIHGYVNSKETQSPFAIELARRGFVVLAVDQSGHGYSDPPAFADGFGGPPALRYMQSLSFVDDDNVGLEGHSMGGWAAVSAAESDPDGYEAVVLEGSSTGSFGAPEGNETFPRNLAVVYAEYDEFSMLMWNVPRAGDVDQSEKLQTVFGTDGPVEEGRTYGDADAGTARRLYTPTTTHPGNHLSTRSVAAAVEWFQLHLEGGDDRPPGDQIWFLKELGTLLSLLGGLLFVFPAGALVLDDERFAAVGRPVPEPTGLTGRAWYGAAAVAAVVPVVLYVPLLFVGQGLVPIGWAFPQQITNGVMVWALGNTVVVGLTVGVWHRRRDPEAATLADYGFDAPDGGRVVAKSLAVAVGVVAGFYALLATVGYVFGTDFRFWVVAVKLPSALQFGVGLRYLPVLTAFFLALEALLHGQLRPAGSDRSFRRALRANWLVVVGGFALLLVVQYASLFATGALLVPVPLLTIVAIQFLVLLSVAAAVSTFFFRRTGRVWTGAFVNALLVTFVLVAGTATHAPL